MSEQEADRSETATPFKLQKARERGQAARSADLTAATVFVSAVAVFSWHGWEMLVTQFKQDRALLAAATHVDTAALVPLIGHLVPGTLILLLPLLLVLVVAAVAATVLQRGATLSIEPLKADFSRLNPATGFKRVFSARTLFEAFRACLKLLVLSLVAWFAVTSLAAGFQALGGVSALGLAKALGDALSSLGWKLAAVLGVVAVLDLGYTRREFAKKMRMSRRELKDEYKQREGDPRIRQRLRELRREMLKRSLALRNTRNADVVVTNPTRLAVALRYVEGEMNAPQLVAKGAGGLAAAMREIAGKNGIPIVRNTRVARRIFCDAEVNSPVPQAVYAEVARIIVWVFAMRGRGAVRTEASA